MFVKFYGGCRMQLLQAARKIESAPQRRSVRRPQRSQRPICPLGPEIRES
jgi:hypothetical protein